MVAKYHNTTLTVSEKVMLHKLINKIMKQGKKITAEKILLQSLTYIEDKSRENPYSIVIKAIQNVMPAVEVKSIRVAGSTYMVPVEVSLERQLSLAIRWIVDNARTRKELHMYQRLGIELLDAYNRTGMSVKKKEELHKMAEANRAFAHYRW